MSVEMDDGVPRRVPPGAVLVVTEDDGTIEVANELVVCNDAALVVGDGAELSIAGGTVEVEEGGQLIFFPESRFTAWGTLLLHGRSYGGAEMETAIDGLRFTDHGKAWIAIAELMAPHSDGTDRMQLVDKYLHELRNAVEPRIAMKAGRSELDN